MGIALWLALLIAFWPGALSFADEVGYVGQAKLLLRGQLRPTPLDPGIWIGAPDGTLVGKYPLLPALLLAPLFWLWPRAVFALSVLSAIALSWGAYRLLARWGRRPEWALLVLAHPSVAILARTAMMDVLLSALTVAAWVALRGGTRAAIALAFAALASCKPIGLAIAGALLVGELVRSRWRRGAEGGEPDATRELTWGALGWLLGAVVTAVLTFAATSSARMGYQLAQPEGLPFFAPAYVPQHGWLYLQGLLLCPPLLALGALPLWRRREYGALLAVVGLVAAMSAYFFADRGARWAETLVLGQRLILPAVSLLLIGYADGLAAWVEPWLERRPRLRSAASAALIAAPLAVALATSLQHQRWQAPMVHALAAAAPIADRAGGELALTIEAYKAGLLYPGRTRAFAPYAHRSPVVLCSAQSWSHRSARTPLSCTYPTYRREARVATFEVLRAAEPPAGTAPRAAQPRAQ